MFVESRENLTAKLENDVRIAAGNVTDGEVDAAFDANAEDT